MSLKGMTDMVYPVKFDKVTFFKYPTTHKLVPTRGTIIFDINSDHDFKNYTIRTAPDTKLKTIFLLTSLHLPPWLLDAISSHIE